ncbi:MULTISPECIES: hypothetical protein [unclassified Ruegeria]|uniref:hypothetical protein n=1 Tax=unclassified Ruegeria TaxID=2625375 RepID=UPI001ADD2325|nr:MULTISPECIES: hypothetical protein [unclassified Ruegeria]MBO9412479.1 hypothetical protein [Ruegeria sp. R8_1]MBO9416283.1 hypothetical protein [Ruegeria sp. R8_2]
MMDAEILDLLEDIGRSSVARQNPAVTLTGDSAQTRRDQVLRTIRGTVLPRRLEFTAANGDCLAIEVNSSRVTDVFRVRTGIAPDFETQPRDTLAKKLAEIVTDIASAPGPLTLISLQPDAVLEADDVGITFSEISKACSQVELPSEPIVSIVPEPATDDVPADEQSVLTSGFFDGAASFALGRIHIGDKFEVRTDGVCASGQPAHADQTVLEQFVKDLVGWNEDSTSDDRGPQLIVMRPAGGKGTALAALKDGQQTAIVIHESRKLGAAVNLWKSITGSGR